MKTAIETIGSDKCCGCYACVNACPTHALIIDLDEKGFLMPVVEADKCNNCGLCAECCPIINPQVEKPQKSTYYAAWTNDRETRLQSSSGGVFSEIAKVILERGGAVFGAAFDAQFVLRHECVENLQGLNRLRGSKYVQSHLDDTYIKAITLIKNKRPVLFSGTPCQVTALNNLAKKSGNLEALYSCEMMCHGVPSELVFREYLRNVTGDRISELVSYSFRDKKKGWANFGSKGTFRDGSEYFRTHGKDSFMIGYLRNLFLRPICHDCPFAKIHRNSDITLADFWGAPKRFRSQQGVSAVIVNTEKGQKLFDRLSISKIIVTEQQVARKNPRLLTGHITVPSERSGFFQIFLDNGFQEASKKYLRSSIKDSEFVLWLAWTAGLK